MARDPFIAPNPLPSLTAIFATKAALSVGAN